MSSPVAAPFKIATWNVNSLRIRLPHLLRWLDEHQPDVVLLQETKTEDHLFPLDELNQRGYTAAVHGQKSYNGVAILSRLPLTDIRAGLPDLAEPLQCRILAATVAHPTGPLRVVSAYIPNGGELESEKFQFKAAYYGRLNTLIAAEVALHPRFIIGGDFNIAADERDVDDVARRSHNVLFTDDERRWLAEFQRTALLHDALRLVNPEEKLFSWWDYRELAFQKNRGVRIDYIFVSDALKPAVTAVEHHRSERKQPQPSDHIPVMASLSL